MDFTQGRLIFFGKENFPPIFQKDANPPETSTQFFQVGFTIFRTNIKKTQKTRKALYRNHQLFTAQSQLLRTLNNKPFENIVGKRENVGN